jgi:cytochrome c oxidase cbb3-type subunit 3
MKILHTLLILVLLPLGVWTTNAWSAGGKELFRKNCAACHGSDGAGGVGTPLSLPSFIDHVDNEYLIKTIRFGRPGRVMPGFKNLSQEEVGRLVTFMRTWTGNKPMAFTIKPVKGNKTRGKTLFKQKCAACHGSNGEGGKGTGVTFSRPRGLPVLPSALNNQGFLASATDELIKHTIINGREKTPMPPARSLGLKTKDVNDLVAYIRNWQRKKIPAIKTAASEPPIIIRTSPHDLATTLENVKNAVTGANLKLIRIQELDKGLAEKDRENKKQIIVYSCGFNFLYEAMKIDPRVGLFLPCRITIIEHKGKVTIMTINPKRLSAHFNNSELDKLCEQMSEKYNDILDEATI